MFPFLKQLLIYVDDGEREAGSEWSTGKDISPSLQPNDCHDGTFPAEATPAINHMLLSAAIPAIV